MADPYAGIADAYDGLAEPVAAPAAAAPPAVPGTAPLIDPGTGQATAPPGKPPTPEEAAALYRFAQRARSPQELERFALSLRPDRSLGLTNAKEILDFRDNNAGAVSHHVNFDGSSVDAPKTWGEYAGDFGRHLASDVARLGEGVTSIVDVPTRLLGLLMGKGGDVLGVDPKYTAPLKQPVTVGGTVEHFIPTPDDAAGRYSGEALRGVGGVLAGNVVGSVLSRAAGPVAQRVGAVLQSNPGLQVAGGAAGGAAAQGTTDAGGGPLAQAAAALGAGLVAPAAISGSGAAADAVLGRALGAAPAMEDAAASFIRANATKPPEALIRAIYDAPAPVSGADPTLAEVTLDPGLAGVQRGVANISTSAGARMGRQLNTNAQRRLDAVDATLGEGDPAAIPATAAAREQELAGRTAAAVDKVGPQLAPDTAGAQARDALSEGYRAAKARTSDAYGHPLLDENPPVRLRPHDPEDVTLSDLRPRADLAAFQDEAVRSARSALPPQPPSLLQFVRAKGGISSDDPLSGDFRAEGMDSRGQPTLINRSGRPVDQLRELAVEAHYIPEDTSLADFTHMLAGEYRGSMAPRFSNVDESAVLARQEAEQSREWWSRQFDDRGLDPTKMSNEEWVHLFDEVNGTTAGGPRTYEDLRAFSGPGRAAGPFQQAVMAIRDRYFGDGGVEASAPVRNFFRDVLDADEVGLKKLEGWERQARDLAAGAPDRTQAASLRAVAEAIGAKATMESAPGRREALSVARGVRRVQGQAFEEGPVGRALGRGDFGRFDVPDSEVGRVVVPQGRTSGEAADQLARAAPGHAETIVRTEVRAALDGAGSDPRAIGRVAASYKEAISRFPELAKDVAAARESAALAMRFRSTKLGSFLEDGTDPVSAVGKLLSVRDGGAGFRELVKAEGMTAPALAGVRRALGEHLRATSATSQLDEGLASVPSTAKMNLGVKAVLERSRGTNVLTVGQRAVLNAVGRELEADQFARSANRPSGSDTMRNMGLSMRLAELGMHGAPSGAKTILRFLLSLSPAPERRMELIAKAVQDPRFAASLLARPTRPLVTAALGVMRGFGVGASEGVAAESLGNRPEKRKLAPAAPAPADPYSGIADPYDNIADPLPQ